MSIKNKIINGIIQREGGYVDDPADSGGKTRYGITEKVARKAGYDGDMKGLPIELAFDIYATFYWDVLNLDAIEQMSEHLAEEIADTSVNMGPGRAGTYLQRSLNVLNDRGRLFQDLVMDGQIGPASLRALGEYLSQRGDDGEIVLLRMLNALQGAFYVELAERREKDERFIYGWFKERVS